MSDTLDLSSWCNEDLVEEIHKLHATLSERNERIQKRCAEVDSMRIEVSRLTAQHAEKDGQLANAKEIIEHVVCNGRGREFFPFNLDGTMNEMFIRAIGFTKSTNPPVCVPVEIVAKLVEALNELRSMAKGTMHAASCHKWKVAIGECTCGLEAKYALAQSALSLAAPFLAKGESEV